MRGSRFFFESLHETCIRHMPTHGWHLCICARNVTVIHWTGNTLYSHRRQASRRAFFKSRRSGAARDGINHAKAGNDSIFCGIYSSTDHFIPLLPNGGRGVIQARDVGKTRSLRRRIVRFPQVLGGTAVPTANNLLYSGYCDESSPRDGRALRDLEGPSNCCRAYTLSLGRGFTCFALVPPFRPRDQ